MTIGVALSHFVTDFISNDEQFDRSHGKAPADNRQRLRAWDPHEVWRTRVPVRTPDLDVETQSHIASL